MLEMTQENNEKPLDQESRFHGREGNEHPPNVNLKRQLWADAQ
jgi:hypothetical protein